MRLNKDVTYDEQGVQCGEEEINNNLLSRIIHLQKEITELQEHKKTLEGTVVDLTVNLDQSNARKSQLMKQLMELTQKVQGLEMENVEMTALINKLKVQEEKNERQIHMF